MYCSAIETEEAKNLTFNTLSAPALTEDKNLERLKQFVLWVGGAYSVNIEKNSMRFCVADKDYGEVLECINNHFEQKELGEPVKSKSVPIGIHFAHASDSEVQKISRKIEAINPLIITVPKNSIFMKGYVPISEIGAVCNLAYQENHI